MTLQARAFAQSLAGAVRLVERRNTIPVLSTVHLRVTGDTLTMTTTNLDAQATVEIDAGGLADLDTLAPAQALLDLVKSYPADGEIAFDAPTDIDPRLTVIMGRSRTQLASGVRPEHDFPFLAPAEGVTVTTDAVSLADAIKEIAPCMAKHSKPGLAGINLQRSDKGVRLTASDGHRIASRDIGAEVGEGEFPSFTIPRDSVAWLVRQLPRDGWVGLTVGAGRMTITANGVTFTTKRVDYTFPDFSAILAAPDAPAITVGAAELLAAVELATVCTAIKKGDRRLFLALVDGELRMGTRDAEGFDGETFLEVEAEDGAELRAHVPASQLIQALKGMRKGEHVELRAGELPNGAATVRMRSCADPEREATISCLAGDPSATDPNPPALPRPVVMVEQPAPVNAADPGGATTYSVRVSRIARDPRPVVRTFVFPTYAKGHKAFARHLAALEQRCAVQLRAACRYVIPPWQHAGDDDVVGAHDTSAPVSWFTPAQVDEMERRGGRISASRYVFGATTDATIPWPRKAADKPNADRLGVAPELPTGRGRKVEADYAADVLRRYAKRNPAPVAPPEPVAPVVRDRVRIWAIAGAWGYDGEAAPGPNLGFPTLDLTMRHAIACNPGRRVVMVAVPPAEHVATARAWLARVAAEPETAANPPVPAHGPEIAVVVPFRPRRRFDGASTFAMVAGGVA